LLTRHVDSLRETVRKVRQAHPFDIHGWVLLPHHLRCVIRCRKGMRILLCDCG
jgi:putative transposase